MSTSMRDASSRKVTLSSVVVLLLTAVALWALFSADSDDAQRKIVSVKPTTESGRAPTNAEPSGSKASVVVGTKDSKVEGEASIRWIAEAAKELDQVHADGQVLEVELKAKAKQLNPQQVEQLAATAKSPKHPVRDRVFSAYMLVEGRSLTQSALADLAKEPLPEGLAPTPHSEDEVRSGQERALRVMAIDALFEQAKLNEKARHEFRDLVAALKDSTLRAYGERRLAEISGLIR